MRGLDCRRLGAPVLAAQKKTNGPFFCTGFGSVKEFFMNNNFTTQLLEKEFL